VKRGIRYMKVSHRFLESIVRDFERIKHISPHSVPHLYDYDCGDHEISIVLVTTGILETELSRTHSDHLPRAF
jgi:hypothetical protein